jgi:uncharacterized protein (TIGR00369 family)
MELVSVESGRAVGRLPFRRELCSSPSGEVLHGGMTYALADTVGGVAAISLAGVPTPTVDMRMDYLAPATDDLEARAEVLRRGESLTMVRVEVHDAAGEHVATAHGAYKSGGADGATPWSPETGNGNGNGNGDVDGSA